MTTAEQNPLNYPTSLQPFSKSTFEDPPSEYRGAPFWAWVTKQDEAKTVAQVDMFKEMGLGGFHMHTRVGLDIPYMGDEFMRIVRGCVDRAKELGLGAFLYDEDRWPSGFNGGELLKGHPELKGLHVLFTPWAYGEELPYPKPTGPIANAAPVRSELGTLLATYAITLSPSGKLAQSRVVSSPTEVNPDESVWYAYVEPNPPNEYMGFETYPDLLDAATATRFIELTHEKYKSVVGDEFGKTVPSIFTDEPQYSPMSVLDKAAGKQEVFLPWTRSIEKEFEKLGVGELKDVLPRIVWDEEGSGLLRTKYLDLLAEMFSKNYIGVIAKWCDANEILCTGHMNAEPTLASQTAQTGEVMRAYRSMTFPGIDMLCDLREYNTAKQCVSVARQLGRRGVMSELYGVTGWQFTLQGHKGQGDWQAALGVTLRVHHLFWSTMRGEAKRDYPACIGYQSPWWKEYKTVEDHFARVNSALTRGRPVTRVGVIHPIESFWLCYGPRDGNGDEMVFRDKAFEDLTEWLLMGHVDFDFISESLLVEFGGKVDGGKFKVGLCGYDVVILPNLKTLRSTTLDLLNKFTAKGGKVIIAGSSPTLLDAKNAVIPQVKGAELINWSPVSILNAVDEYRDIDMRVSESTLYLAGGARSSSLIYQMREEGDEKFVFICNTDREQPCPVNIAIRGEYIVEVLDTIRGDSWEIQVNVKDGKTHFKWWFDGCESLLLHLKPGTPTATTVQTVLRQDYKQRLDVKIDNITLSEPNALLLDYPTFSFAGGEWEDPEEVMRIDQLLRGRLDYFKKGAKFRQPHTIPESDRKPAGELRLRFEVVSEYEVDGATLAIEDPEQVGILWDREKVDSAKNGWWVDHDISTVPLPPINKGKHTLELVYQYNQLSNLERVFILGDFGVKLRGRHASIVPLDLSQLSWGDITRQDLPFYTGNITYHCTFTSPPGPLAIRVAHFASPCIAVDLDGKRLGLIMIQPHALELGDLGEGVHKVDITCFGDRNNAFGPLHLVKGMTNWLGADAWRSEWDWWSEEYVLGEIGVLNAPRIEIRGKEVLSRPRRGLKAHH